MTRADFMARLDSERPYRPSRAMARGARCLIVLFVCLLASPFTAAGAQGPGPRVIAGSAVQIEDHPYQVQLQEPSGFGFCGGSIRDATHIVTAAHCVALGSDYPEIADPASLRVGYGDEDQVSLLPIDVVQVNVHPAFWREFSFDPSWALFDHADYDVAVLTLEAPGIPTSSTSAPISFADATERTNATQGFVTGWGATVEGAEEQSPSLQGVFVPLKADTVCETVYGASYSASLMECAGGTANHAGGEPDTCNGDSGGPLAIDTDPSNSVEAWELIGVTSFGDGCGRDNIPGVYSEVLSGALLPFVSQATLSPPPAPPAAASIIGTPEVGETLTCSPTVVPGLDLTRYLWFIVDGSSFEEIVGQNGQTLVVPAEAAGAAIACDVRYEKDLSGFTYALMDAVDAVAIPSGGGGPSGGGLGTGAGTGAGTGGGSTFAPDTLRPLASVGRISCAMVVGRSRRCRVRISASDVGGLVRSLSAKLTYRVRRCREVGGRRVCTSRRRTKRLRSVRTTKGFRLSFRLRPGRYRLIVVATDTAGNRSTSVSKRFRVRRP